MIVESEPPSNLPVCPPTIAIPSLAHSPESDSQYASKVSSDIDGGRLRSSMRYWGLKALVERSFARRLIDIHAESAGPSSGISEIGSVVEINTWFWFILMTQVSTPVVGPINTSCLEAPNLD